jgi:probable phosphoglycerate mutase
MRIYFIRHGNPDYKNDCLTNVGHLQAKACAKRLKNEGIQKIFSSTMGRAVETAAHTAKELGLDVEYIDFIRELNWRSINGEAIFMDGHPWYIVDDMVLNGENLLDTNWAKTDRFSSSVIEEHVKRVSDGIDKWLKSFGYEREGNYYRVIGDNTDQTIAIFSHAGSSSAALSYLLSLPFPWVFQSIRLEFTSITIIDLENENGTLTFPRLTLLNDARHLEGIESEIFFGN